MNAAQTPSASRSFGLAAICWEVNESSKAILVKVYFKDELLVERILDPQRRTVPFSAFDQDNEPILSGTFLYTESPLTLSVSDLVVDGKSYGTVALYPGRPAPTPGDHPEPDQNTAVAITPSPRDVFSYIMLNDWPRITKAQWVDNFVQYVPPEDQNPESYLGKIFATGKDRPELEALSADFIDGKQDYALKYAARALELEGVLQQFNRVSQELWDEDDLSVDEFIDRAVHLINLESKKHWTWEKLVNSMDGPVYVAQRTRAWSTLIALNIDVGYDWVSSEQMTRTVTFANLLERMAHTALARQKEEKLKEIPYPPETEWPWPRIADGLHATVVLPTALFPISTPGGKQSTGVLPYAIGDLHLVKRRVKGYELGEVSRIESIMAGERKTSMEYETQSQIKHDSSETQSAVASDDITTSCDDEFERSANKTLREQYKYQFCTKYGPASETTKSGHKTLMPYEDKPTRKVDKSQQGQSREITEVAARNTTENVLRRRHVIANTQSGSSTRHDIDARKSSTNQRGIYRWLDVVFKCWEQRYGRRLVLEAILPDPSKLYQQSVYGLSGINAKRPTDPKELGLNDFSDVSQDPKSPTYFGALESIYQIADIAEPPSGTPNVSANFSGQTGPLFEQVEIPNGYEAVHARVQVLPPTLDAKVSVAVAGEIIDLQGGHGSKDLAHLSGALAIATSVESTTQSNAGDSDQNAETLQYGITVQIKCQPDAQALQRWKVQVYGQVMRAYAKQLDQFRALYGQSATPTTELPDHSAQLETIKAALRRDLMTSLITASNVALDEPESADRLLPRQVAFLENVLEWSAVSFTFDSTFPTASGPASAQWLGSDQPMSAFLQATRARVLIPVSPGRERTVAYFLATGSIPTGPDEFVPCVATSIDPQDRAQTTYIDLVNMLKAAKLGHDQIQNIGSPWEVRMPTTLSVLQESDALPHFADED